MNVGVILVQIWCNTLCDDTHDIHDIAREMHDIKRYYTIFTISNGIAKTPRDKVSRTRRENSLSFAIEMAKEEIKTAEK